jgi:hypothetical protein
MRCIKYAEKEEADFKPSQISTPSPSTLQKRNGQPAYGNYGIRRNSFPGSTGSTGCKEEEKVKE